jgi:hypothetical protein
MRSNHTVEDNKLGIDIVTKVLVWLISAGLLVLVVKNILQ